MSVYNYTRWYKCIIFAKMPVAATPAMHECQVNFLLIATWQPNKTGDLSTAGTTLVGQPLR